jgi:hypothetical protein
MLNAITYSIASFSNQITRDFLDIIMAANSEVAGLVQLQGVQLKIIFLWNSSCKVTANFSSCKFFFNSRKNALFHKNSRVPLAMNFAPCKDGLQT